MSDNKPTASGLDACLKDMVKTWKRFALHLPRIKQRELDIIEVNKPGDVIAQKIELYEVWLQVYPNASWNDVIIALEVVGENTIAKQLREKFLASTIKEETDSILPQKKSASFEAISADPISSSTVTIPPPSQTTVTPDEVSVSEEVVTELNTLQQSFKGLADDVETGVEDNIENGKLTIKKVTRHLKREQAFLIPSLNSVTTADDLFDAIRPHCNFLNCYLIVSIALSFLSRAITEKATKYKKKVGEFMKTTKIRSFQNALKHSRKLCERSVSTTVVEIVVENAWEEQELWLVENLIKTLFPVKHPDELPWYDIVPGSVVMTFIALEHMTPSLIENSRKKTEFMRLIGVISLKIGNELVWKKEGNNNPLSFEDGLIQAAVANNIEVAQFLLQYTQLNVNTKNTTNTLINAGDEENYWSQETVEDILSSEYSTFTAILKAVEYELQYVQGQMTAVDNDSNSSPPAVANGDSKSAHHSQDNFLNGRVLAGLSDQLPKPLSTRVKQYQAEIEQTTNRVILLIHLSSSLEKYFPTPFPDSIVVILTLHSAWRACSVWYIEQLGQLIFTPTLFHKLQWFRVDTSEESLRVALLADKELMDGLIEKYLGNDESLTPLLGVISVQVDDTIVISNDYSNGYTFYEGIELAKRNGNDEIFNLLLQIHQSPVDFNRFREADNNDNRSFLPEPDSTPLMIACCNDNSQLVQLLLDHNADPNVQTRNGCTALMYSTANSNIFQMLLDHGADIETCMFVNETVLNFACWAGNVKIVKAITAINRDLVHITSSNGWTPLMDACEHGNSSNTEIVKMLLQKKIDPNIQAYNGHTALYVASRSGHTAAVELLLQAKANPNVQDDEGRTALIIACELGHTAIVELLLQAGADVSRDAQIALQLAQDNNHSEIAEKLCQAISLA